MKLDEYKTMIEAQRKASLANALTALTNANNALENNFNVKDKENN